MIKSVETINNLINTYYTVCVVAFYSYVNQPTVIPTIIQILYN